MAENKWKAGGIDTPDAIAHGDTTISKGNNAMRRQYASK